MSQSARQAGEAAPDKPERRQGLLWGVRYQVKDVSRSINFYTHKARLKLDH